MAKPPTGTYCRDTPRDPSLVTIREVRNMPKVETSGVVSQRSDRWFMSGVTTFFVSGVLTISWRIYTAGKVHFWSAWPGVLGVAVVGASFIMIAVAVALERADGGPGQVDNNSGSDDHR